MNEIWKDIKGYEGLYQVSNTGKVCRVKKDGTRKPPLKMEKMEGGYYRVTLSKKGKSERHPLHHLVANAFIPNPLNKPCIDHIDTNPSNNNVNNLRWVTHKENSNNPLTKQHLSEANKGEKNPMYGRTGEKHHNYNKKVPKDIRKKISNTLKGRKLPLSTKEKISKGVVGFPLDGGDIVEYYSMSEAERRTGISRRKIKESCEGKREGEKYDWYLSKQLYSIVFEELM